MYLPDKTYFFSQVFLQSQWSRWSRFEVECQHLDFKSSYSETFHRSSPGISLDFFKSSFFCLVVVRRVWGLLSGLSEKLRAKLLLPFEERQKLNSLESLNSPGSAKTKILRCFKQLNIRDPPPVKTWNRRKTFQEEPTDQKKHPTSSRRSSGKQKTVGPLWNLSRSEVKTRKNSRKRLLEKVIQLGVKHGEERTAMVALKAKLLKAKTSKDQNDN